MPAELDPRKVAARLEALRRLTTPTFDELVARRLAELRALYELARHLRAARVPDAG